VPLRLVTAALVTLLVLVHAELWFGRHGVHRVMELQGKLTEHRTKNDRDRERNEQLAAEVSDLKEGLEMVEEKARYELGMIKPNEVYVQVTPPPR
jgi:cell division protein FtsB